MTHTMLRMFAVIPVVALALAACSTGSDKNEKADAITVVASTDVYGDIAKAIGGDAAAVTSLITSSTQDPHEYEPSAQDKLALDHADVVIENGGGYDPFVDKLVNDSSGSPTVINAVDVSGLDARHVEGFNEHVWYDFPAVEKVAKQISEALSEADPKHAASYESNFANFTGKVESLEATVQRLKARANGRGVAITEPVPLYLLQALGLVNRTPPEFSEAVEEGADVPPRVLQETLDLFKGSDIAVLAYNPQTANDTTEQVRQAAESAGITVVNFTETLSDGKSYIDWQRANLDDLARALG